MQKGSEMNALKFDPEKPSEMTMEDLSDVIAGGDAARMVMYGYQNGYMLHHNIMLEAAKRLRRLGTGNSNRLRLALSMAIDYMKDAGCAASAVSALEGVLRMPSRNCDEFDGTIEATMAFKGQKGRMPDAETMSWCFAKAKESGDGR